MKHLVICLHKKERKTLREKKLCWLLSSYTSVMGGYIVVTEELKTGILKTQTQLLDQEFKLVSV